MSWFKYKRIERNWERDYGRFMSASDERFLSRAFLVWSVSIVVFAYWIKMQGISVDICSACLFMLENIPAIEEQSKDTSFPDLARMVWSYALISGLFLTIVILVKVDGVSWGSRPKSYLILFIVLGALASEQILIGSIFGIEIDKTKLSNRYWRLYSEIPLILSLYILSLWFMLVWLLMITKGFIRDFFD